MKKDDLLVIGSLILYILSGLEERKRSVYFIVKTAYFAQQKHLAEYGSLLYNDVIKALQFGPAPSTVYDILKLSRGDNSVLNFYTQEEKQYLAEIANNISFNNELFNAKINPDMDYLSVSDIKCLDQSIEKISGMSFNEVCEATHTENGEWKRAFNSRNKKLNEIGIAKEGNATPEMLDYLANNLYINTALS